MDSPLPAAENELTTAPGVERRWPPRLERVCFCILAGLACLYLVATVALLPGRATTWDFSHYYASALVLREGGDPYITNLAPIGARLGLTIRQIDRGTYPPTFLLCFSPLTRLPVRTAYFIWQSFSIACLIAALFLLMRNAMSPRAARWLILGVIFYAPVQLHLVLAQSQFMVLLMLVAVIMALERSREAEAGLILAAAVLLRAFPIAMGGYLLARRYWKAIGWLIAGLLAGGAITAAAVGLRTFLDFRVATALITSHYFLAQPSNIALGSFISRMYWHASDAGLIAANETLRQVLSMGASTALGLAALALTWSRTGHAPDPDRRAYSLWIVTAILVSPTAWDHYLVLLLLPFIHITVSALHGRVSRSAVNLCILCYVFAEAGFLVFALNGFVHAHGFLTTELGFITAAIGWIGIAIFARSQTRPSASLSRLRAGGGPQAAIT